MINVRLMVDVAGQPTSCGVQVEMSHKDFEKTACNILMKDAVFAPALDAQGNPIASYYVETIQYSISRM